MKASHNHEIDDRTKKNDDDDDGDAVVVMMMMEDEATSSSSSSSNIHYCTNTRNDENRKTTTMTKKHLLQRRFILNQRVYIVPYVFCTLLYHLPVFICMLYYILYGNGRLLHCTEANRVSQWLMGAGITHVFAAVISIGSAIFTLCSPVYVANRKERYGIMAMYVFHVFDLGWAIYGRMVVLDDNDQVAFDCVSQDGNSIGMLDTLSIYSLVFSSLNVLFWALFTLMCGPHYHNEKQLFQRRWTNRCVCLYRLLTCSRHTSELDEVFEHLGCLLEQFLTIERSDGSYETVEFSDITFAFGLVKRAQALERQDEEDKEDDDDDDDDDAFHGHDHDHDHDEKQQQKTQQRVEGQAHDVELTQPPQRVSTQTLQELDRYAHLAGAMYGWSFYVFYNPCSWLTLCGRATVPRSPGAQVIKHDNKILSNQKAFIKYAQIEPEELVYMNRYNELFKVPYAIVKDRRRKEFVIALRGSLSWVDFLTDGFAKQAQMRRDETPFDGQGPIYTHEGILRTARALFAHLQQGSRRRLFWDFMQSNRDWKVSVCGHSLGGGIACILTLLLRKRFATTTGYAFAPPPVLNEAVAKWATCCLTAVVYGDDVVSRLSVTALARLREEMLEQYSTVVHKPLYKVYTTKQKKQANNRRSNRTTTGTDRKRGGDGQLQEALRPQYSSSVVEVMNEWKDRFYPTQDDYHELDLAGQVLHVETADGPSRRCGCTVFRGQQELKCTRKSAHAFKRILLSARMIPDHMPHHYDRALRHCAVVQQQAISVEHDNATAGYGRIV